MDLQELESIKKKYLAEVNMRKNADTSGVDYKYDIMVCGGTGCRSCKSKKVQDRLETIVKEKGLENLIKIHGVGCFGLCVNGPIVLIYPYLNENWGHTRYKDFSKVMLAHLGFTLFMKFIFYA